MFEGFAWYIDPDGRGEVSLLNLVREIYRVFLSQ